MIGLFGKASGRLCEKLDKAAAEGEAVEMESLFSRLTLDVIGKAIFNYDFDSLSYDNGMVEVIAQFFSGGVCNTTRSRNAEHFSYTNLEDTHMERHLPSTEEG